MARPKLGEGETERLHVKITAKEIAAIDDWRYANRIPSRSEAVRRLCQMGLALDIAADPLMEQAAKLTETVAQAARQHVGPNPKSGTELQGWLAAWTRTVGNLVKVLQAQQRFAAKVKVLTEPVKHMRSAGSFEEAEASAKAALEKLVREMEDAELKRGAFKQ